MSDPQRQAPPERPDPSALLIDAVIQRQSDLAQRLAQQWVHRRGWPSLDSFVKGPLLSNCGPEALEWLRQRLGLESPAAVLREALAEAMAPLRESSPAAPASGPSRLSAVAPTGPATTAENPWQLPPLEPTELEPNRTVTPLNRTEPRAQGRTAPAPAPADLAALRAWLHSDAA